VLGPVELRVDGRAVNLPGPKQRVVLATLAAEANRVVSAQRLVDSSWGDDPPRSAEHAIQQHVSVIRKQLEAAGVTDPAAVLVTRPPGYSLIVDASDAAEWESARFEWQRAMGSSHWVAAAEAIDRGLHLWRGSAFEDIEDSALIRGVRVRLDEQRLVALETRAEALLAAGYPAEAASELEPLVAANPLREGLWSKLMLALYQSGRQADALAAYRSARLALVDGLGIEPSAELRELETAILQQSPRLDLTPPPAPGQPAPDDELFATFLSGSGQELGRVLLPDGQEVVLPAGANLIGRDPTALIRLVDNRVSRRHAMIEATVAGCSLRDLGSSNGTTVNGELVIDRVLADEDVIGIGGVSLRFRRFG
jgi:DNA-binding SARP family transcriptional activator